MTPSNVSQNTVKSAIFVKSSAQYDQLPALGFPEYAFIGRSNVGKSSLINAICNQKNLAKTSATPGKTQLINHFLINNLWYLVDLPGYGYAKVSKRQRGGFQKLIFDYFDHRETLACVFLLLDSRIPPQESDLSYMQKIAGCGLSIALVLTKTDKLSATQLESQINIYKKTLTEYWEELPPIFITSAETRAGKNEILAFIDEANQNFNTFYENNKNI